LKFKQLQFTQYSKRVQIQNDIFGVSFRLSAVFMSKSNQITKSPNIANLYGMPCA
jgi:hypothetical protein